MSNTKHTPGPWHVTTSFSGKRAIAQSADLYSVALIEEWRGEESEANAQLIAAAPDLLEAVKALQTVIIEMRSGTQGQETEWTDCLLLANDAIAKATGKEVVL